MTGLKKLMAARAIARQVAHQSILAKAIIPFSNAPSLSEP